MNKETKKRESDIPFMKAYNFVLGKPNLTSAEKLVMIVLCRFWPNPYWDSNSQVAKTLGFTERYIEKIIKSLASKRIIKRGYAHVNRNRRLYTVRVIMPRCFPEIPGHKIKWIKPEHMGGGQTEHMDGCSPNNSSFLPEQKDDLLEENRRGKERTPEPLPGGGQAPAEKREPGQQANTRRSKNNNFRIHRRRQTPELTPEEMEQSKKAQIKALLGSQVKKLEQAI
jgi:hypothetical protein